LINSESDEDVLRTLRAGAVGYLLKSALQDEITQAVESISHNQRCIPPHIAQRLSEAATYESLSNRYNGVYRRPQDFHWARRSWLPACTSHPTPKNRVAQRCEVGSALG